METFLDKTSSIFPLIISLFAALAGIFQVVSLYRRQKQDVQEVTDLITKIRKTSGEVNLDEKKGEKVRTEIEDEKYALFLRYHSQGLSQSKISFWFSLIFASIGFAIIVNGILAIQKDTALWSQSKAFISLISGTIIDAVSALFFVQSNKSRQLMIDFFDKLRTDRKFEESLKLSEKIPNINLKSKIQTLLAINFAEVTVSDSLLTQMFNGIEPHWLKSSEGDFNPV